MKTIGRRTMCRQIGASMMSWMEWASAFRPQDSYVHVKVSACHAANTQTMQRDDNPSMGNLTSPDPHSHCPLIVRVRFALRAIFRATMDSYQASLGANMDWAKCRLSISLTPFLWAASVRCE